MINRFLKIHAIQAALLMGTLGALTLDANAQSATAKVSVPFEFAAGGVKMPAGEYTLDRTDFSGVIIIRGMSGNSVALISTYTEELSHTSTATLLFEKHDGMAYLSAVGFLDQSVHMPVPPQRVTKGAATASLH